MIGSRLGPYEITAKLGEGGMGEVWRARDLQLGREVALKILPDAFTDDAERTARFEREAKVLASLNHPNIAQIYGLETSGDRKALVMELVEGPTLADRLEQGPLPFNESVRIARQIAEALEEAHEKGIVHRDLKPQNVKAPMEGKVKVLDFGLARALEPAVSSSGGPVTASPTLMNSPTLTAAATQLGVILGTAAYMSPEQAKGAAVDARADVWAFGVVLWEMLTGARMFAADSVPETLAGVLKSEIDFDALPAETPPAVRRLLRRCLERSPRNRLHAIADARIVLDEVAGGELAEEVAVGPAAPAISRRTIAWTALAALAAGAALGGLALRGPGGRAGDPVVGAPDTAASVAFSVREPGGIVVSTLGISPDGRILIYTAKGDDGVRRLWKRALDRIDPEPLPGTERARYPFFSPDGSEIAFEADGELRRLRLDRGSPRTVAHTGGNLLGGAWCPDGTLLLGNRKGPLLRVPAAGGQPTEAIARLELEGTNTIHAWPSLLADGRRFVYLADGSGGTDGESHRFLLGSLDGGPARQLLATLRSGLLVDPRGALLYMRNDQLLVQRLDADRAELVGEPELVADRVTVTWDYHELPAAIARDGTLVYRTGSADQRLEWVDRQGRPLATVVEGENVRNPRLSRDGRFLAAETDHSEEERTVWILDLERGVRTLLSERGTLSDSATWSPDGRWVYFDTERGSLWHVVRQPREGSPEAEEVLTAPLPDAIVQDVSPDGALLLYTSPSGGTWDYFLAPLGRLPAAPELWLDSRGTVEAGRFSPDGRWIAYVTDESGRREVYVGAVEGAAARRFQISSLGGTEPVWDPAGDRLYFRSLDNRLMAAPVEIAADRIVARAAEPLFDVAEFPADWVRSTFEVGPDGRFLVVRPTDEEDVALRVVTRWRPALLR